MDSSRSYRRLVKNVAGSISTLWQDGVAYTVGNDSTFVIDAVGSRLVGYLGDERPSTSMTRATRWARSASTRGTTALRVSIS